MSMQSSRVINSNRGGQRSGRQSMPTSFAAPASIDKGLKASILESLLEQQQHEEESFRSIGNSIMKQSLRESISLMPGSLKLILTYRGENKVTHINLQAPDPCTFTELVARSRAKFRSLRDSTSLLRFKFTPVHSSSAVKSIGNERAPVIIEVDDQAGIALINQQEKNHCSTYQVEVISFDQELPPSSLPAAQELMMSAMPFDRGYLTGRSERSSVLLKNSIVAEDTHLSQVRQIKPVHVYNLIQRLKSQEMVTRRELIDIVDKAEKTQILPDLKQSWKDEAEEFMQYCVDAMREIYSQALLQSTVPILGSSKLNQSTSLTGSANSAPDKEVSKHHHVEQAIFGQKSELQARLTRLQSLDDRILDRDSICAEDLQSPIDELLRSMLGDDQDEQEGGLGNSYPLQNKIVDKRSGQQKPAAKGHQAHHPLVKPLNLGALNLGSGLNLGGLAASIVVEEDSVDLQSEQSINLVRQASALDQQSEDADYSILESESNTSYLV